MYDLEMQMSAFDIQLQMLFNLLGSIERAIREKKKK